MRKLVLVALLATLSNSAYASCVGSSSVQTCYDAQSGNSYTVQRYGNTTSVYGSNAQTGSTWSQQSYDYGHTTQTYGTDSKGNSWSQTCGKLGCY